MLWIGLPAICKKTGYGKIQPQKPGGMAEWFKAPVLKTGMVKAIVGSNPSPSACFRKQRQAKPPGEVPEWLNGIAC
jgi:hypothetical protein